MHCIDSSAWSFREFMVLKKMNYRNGIAIKTSL